MCNIESIIAAVGEHTLVLVLVLVLVLGDGDLNIAPPCISAGADRLDWTDWIICSILGSLVLCFSLD